MIFALTSALAQVEQAGALLKQARDDLSKTTIYAPMSGTVSETTAFRVKALEANAWLLWDKPDSTWAWRLTPLPGGQTRLVTRLKQHYRWESPAMALLTVVLLEFGDFPMMRRVLGGIKSRAERARPADGEWP